MASTLNVCVDQNELRGHKFNKTETTQSIRGRVRRKMPVRTRSAAKRTREELGTIELGGIVSTSKRSNQKKPYTKQKKKIGKNSEEQKRPRMEKISTTPFQVEGDRQNETSNLLANMFELIERSALPSDDHCHICLLEFEEGEPEAVIRLVRCNGHYFHKPCIEKWFETKPKCPSCTIHYGEEIGTQPDGEMVVRRTGYSLPGFSEAGTIEIMYNVPSGIQSERHPNPGSPFYGTRRMAYLPDTDDGNVVLNLLKRAFQNRLVFTVGRSLTTGMDNCVVWNGIHHKTSRSGGTDCFGYPDPTYLNRVTLELASKGLISGGK